MRNVTSLSVVPSRRAYPYSSPTTRPVWPPRVRTFDRRWSRKVGRAGARGTQEDDRLTVRHQAAAAAASVRRSAINGKTVHSDRCGSKTSQEFRRQPLSELPPRPPKM